MLNTGSRMYQNHYGDTLYNTTLYERLTGMDWGRDRCVRNSMEAYACFSKFMSNARDNIGWDATVVQHVVNEAFRYRGTLQTDASVFWTAIRKNLIQWISQTGYEVVDMPKYDKVLATLDSATEGAFDYKLLKDENSQFFQNVALATTGDIWDYWQQVPPQVRYIAYGIGGLMVISYTMPIISSIAKLLTIHKDKE